MALITRSARRNGNRPCAGQAPGSKEPDMVELVRGWKSQHAPEATGQIRLSKVAFYRDVELLESGVRDEKEGKASVLATLLQQAGKAE